MSKLTEVKPGVKEEEPPQVLNINNLIKMSGGPSAMKFVTKFVSTFEQKSLNETLRELHKSWLAKDVKQMEFFSHKAKGASLYALMTQAAQRRFRGQSIYCHEYVPEEHSSDSREARR